MKSTMKRVRRPLAKPAAISVGAAVTFMAGYVILAEAVMRWLDERYSVLDDWSE